MVHQDLAAVLRCHVAAFEALGGAPRELLYDRMKTAVIGEGDDGGIVCKVANPRVHATTQRIVNEVFAEERSHLSPCRWRRSRRCCAWSDASRARAW